MAHLALKGGAPVRNTPISPWPLYGTAEKEYLMAVLESREWGKTSGKMNERLETKFSEFQHVRHTITVCNGTVALRIALVAAGIGPGDEVIIPSYTFVATATAVLEANAIPVFADIDPRSFNIAPESIEELVTDRTRAIIPVHFAGAPADMPRIMDIARRHGIRVIEDAAQAQGSVLDGTYAGAFGDAGMFSFQLSKNMTAGEGGAVVTDDDEIAARVRSFHNCGRKVGEPWYYHFTTGGNYRLSEFQAAVLLGQLEREEAQLEKRIGNAGYLDRLLAETEGIEPVVYPRNVRSSYYLYVATYQREAFNGIPKHLFIQAMNAEGIPAYPGYPFPLYRQPLFRDRAFWKHGCPFTCSHYGKEIDYRSLHHPASEQACETGFWFPNFALLGDRKDIDDVAEAIHKIRTYSAELLERGNR